VRGGTDVQQSRILDAVHSHYSEAYIEGNWSGLMTKFRPGASAGPGLAAKDWLELGRVAVMQMV
jgi:hypothetical protein